jgi:SAM-dependent methyltransferase
MSKKKHWEGIYSHTPQDKVGWYQEKPAMSLSLIEKCGLEPTANILDVGGGASNLVDHLIDLQYEHITVFDLSSAGLEKSKERLGENAAKVDWIVGDITDFDFKQTFDLWHDRAVFHFLTEKSDRDKYIANLRKALKPGGRLIMGAFCLEGPEKCSGLKVERYSDETLGETLGPDFAMIESQFVTHTTPFDTTQEYVFCLFKRV